MKRISNLFDRIWDVKNLEIATHRASKGKLDRISVREFHQNLDNELQNISQQIREGSFQFRDYSVFQIRDTKTRTIHAPTFRDRVVHHAIISITGDILEMGAMDHSYACRKGKGQHLALHQARRWTRRQDWYGKLDVEKFYDSVDHSVLRDRLHRRFRESRLLDLWDRLLDSYQTQAGKGLPIGALTSQYLGNFYLDSLDTVIQRLIKMRRYLRYMDDMVLWGTKEQLREAWGLIEERLSELKLKAKHGGEWNQCEQGVPFLGFVVYPNRLRLNRAGRRRFRRKFKMLEQKYLRGAIRDDAFGQNLEGLMAHASFGDDSNWRKAVFQFSRVD